MYAMVCYKLCMGCVCISMCAVFVHKYVCVCSILLVFNPTRMCVLCPCVCVCTYIRTYVRVCVHMCVCVVCMCV